MSEFDFGQPQIKRRVNLVGRVDQPGVPACEQETMFTMKLQHQRASMQESHAAAQLGMLAAFAHDGGATPALTTTYMEALSTSLNVRLLPLLSLPSAPVPQSDALTPVPRWYLRLSMPDARLVLWSPPLFMAV